jgi:hypothetical protein
LRISIRLVRLRPHACWTSHYDELFIRPNDGCADARR